MNINNSDEYRRCFYFSKMEYLDFFEEEDGYIFSDGI